MTFAPKIRCQEFFTWAKDFISDETERYARENPHAPPLSDVSSDDFIAFVIRTQGDRFNFHNIKRWSKDARRALSYVGRSYFANHTAEAVVNTNTNHENMMNRSLVPRNVSGFYYTFDNPPQTTSMLEQQDAPVSEQMDLDEPQSKRKRKQKKTNQPKAEPKLSAEVPSSDLANVPFIDRHAIDRLVSLAVACRLRHNFPEFSSKSSCNESATGCLILGPRGCGKTALVQAVAGDIALPLVTASAFSFVGGPSSGEALKKLFEKALENAPCILLITQAEALPIHYSGKVQASANHLDLFLECMRRCADHVVVLGETNSSQAQLNDTVKQVFPKSVTLAAMDLPSRQTALRHLVSAGRWSGRFSAELIEDLARRTPGYEVGDLARLLDELDLTAPMADFHRLLFDESGKRRSQPLDLAACLSHYRLAKLSSPDIVDAALASVVPLARQKPGFVTVPNVTWEDVGALEEAKQEMERFLTLVREPQLAEQLCREAESLLLVGPPGCGKTMLAKAVSNEAGLNFISVKGPELLDKYQGESERHVREVFERARACPPCLIFFDELDALCSRRGSDSGDGRSSVVLQLLTEMDGLTPRGRVFVMGATNRLDVIDEAFLRRGRMGRVVFVGPPSSDAARAAVLKALCRNGTRPRIEGDVAAILERLAAEPRVAGFSCAELRGVIDEAKFAAQLAQRPHLTEEDLGRGLEEVCRERETKTAARR